MGWSAIIAGLIDVFGPILAAWVKEWFQHHLTVTAAAMTNPADLDPAEARVRLLETAVHRLPHVAVFRRALLRRMRDSYLSGQPQPEDLAAIAGIARQAEAE